MDESSERTQVDQRPAEAASTTEPAGASWFPCPYCGERQAHGSSECGACGGLFEPLSRQATQNQMGPWFVRDESAPFVPGRSYATIRRMAQRGKITGETVLRGPSTRQFWMAAAHAPGVAHLLGRCHACGAAASAEDFSCNACGAAFSVSEDRQTLGLAPVRLLPGQAAPAMVARSAAAPAPSATAFSRLADSAAPAGAPRPAAPAPMAPATGTVAAARRAAPGARGMASASASEPVAPASADAGDDEAPALRRSLRTASRRVAALRNLVIALAVANVVVLAVLLATALGGDGDAASGSGGSGGAPQAERGSSE